MAKKTTKTEHDMQFVKPSTQPIINQKTQQKQKKKQPAVDEKNLQKTKIQKYKEEIKRIPSKSYKRHIIMESISMILPVFIQTVRKN